MAQLVNELSWSVSRQGLFQECRRAYYYTYYGSWGGWEDGCTARTRRLYILKNLKTLDMWAGSVVHDTVAEALRRHAQKGAPILAAELQAVATGKLRAGWKEAVERAWEKRPKLTNLWELYYGNGRSLPAAETERIRAKVMECLRAFAESAVLKEVLAASYLSWKPIEQLDSFLLDGLKVWCVVDFAYTDPAGLLRILDWKTGGEDTEALQLQLACYAFFAGEKWSVPPERLRVYGVFLRDNARGKEFPVTAASLIDARDRIVSGAAEMRSVLRDVARNGAVEEDFPLAAEERACRRCNYREVCPRFAAAPVA